MLHAQVTAFNNLVKQVRICLLYTSCRGGVVKEEDLIRALRSGRLRGAGLDVLACEPTGAENPLLTMDNVFITSHMGAESAESGYRSQNIMALSLIHI